MSDAAEPIHAALVVLGSGPGGYTAAFRAADLGLEARSIGLPPAPRFKFSDDEETDAEMRHAFFRELYLQGVFAADPFLMSFSHQESDIEEALSAMKTALATTAEAAL